MTKKNSIPSKKKKTPRKPAALSLKERCCLLREFMDAIPDAVYLKDAKGVFVMVNTAYAGKLGLASEDIIGKTDFDIFPENRAKRSAREDAAVMRTGKAVMDKIERAARTDGIEHYVSTTRIPRRDAKGKVVGLIGVNRNVPVRVIRRLGEQHAGRTKALEQAEEFEKIKSEFISTVSHELRTPLATVTQLLLLVFDETAGPINDQQREILVRTKHNLDRLKNMIDNLLDMSRIERGRLKLHYSLTDLRTVFKETEGFFKGLAREKNITLRYNFPAHDVTIFIDVERICQVISNLLCNAVKFTGDNGKITVEVKLLESRVRVGIMDTGIGIGEKDLQRVFDKFVQGPAPESARAKGVGLGLSIVKEIIERHGGEIWVESQAGAGSCFYFTLPRFYAANILEKPVKEKIQEWLAAGIHVHLINILIVHFETLPDQGDMPALRIARDVQALMEAALKKIPRARRQKQTMVLSDVRHGKYSILTAGGAENEIADFCRSFKHEAKRYFIQHKIDDVFVAVGTGAYHRESSGPGEKDAVPKAHVQETYIGSEMRRFKRIAYKTAVHMAMPGRARMECQSVDISEGGLCVIGPKKLTTNARLSVEFQLARVKKTVHVDASVSWISKLERSAGQPAVRYKMGLEFLGLGGEQREILLKELGLYHG